MLNAISAAAIIVSVCLLLHVAGILLMAEWLLRHREYLRQRAGWVRHAIVLILVFSGVMFLHLLETILWAGFYYGRGLFDDIETALYFSLTSYTTIGYGDVLLPQRWRLLGPIEGISGVLLSGISTAFMFAVISSMLQINQRNQKTL